MVSFPSTPTIKTRYARKPFGWNTNCPRKSVRPKRHSGESGVQVSGLRYYSPNLGRWVSSDPIGERGGRNTHAFVRNSPLGSFDATGLVDTSGVVPADAKFLDVHFENSLGGLFPAAGMTEVNVARLGVSHTI